MPSGIIQRLMTAIFDRMETDEKAYITYHKRPKYAENIHVFADNIVDISGVFIVMQGPVLKEDDFTFNTLKLYRKYFKDAKIILSTWTTEDVQYLDINKEYYDFLILNEMPANKGHHNINLQITSAKAGILRAKEERAEYILRTRTDQRIYNPNSLNYFISLLEKFPAPDRIKQGRLIVNNIDTLKFRPFGISDMMMFGLTGDVFNYWNIDLDERKLDHRQLKTVMDFAQLRTCETYLATTYLNNLSVKWDFNLKDTWEIYKDFFIIIDAAEIDIFWVKYDRRTEYKFNYYDGSHSYQVAKMTDWLPRLVFDNTSVDFDIERTDEGRYLNNTKPGENPFN
jgi:hypothetical protein